MGSKDAFSYPYFVSRNFVVFCQHHVYCRLLDHSPIIDPVLLFDLSEDDNVQAPKRPFLSPQNKNAPTEAGAFFVSSHWALDLNRPI